MSNDNANANFLNADWWKTATIEDVKAEIANGADVNTQSTDLLRPIEYAARYAEDPEIIKTLTDAGAKLEKKHALYQALIFNKNLNIILYMINKLGCSGDESLAVIAAENPNPDVFLAVMPQNFYINTKFDESTALMHACMNTNPEMFKLLLKLGADIHAHNEECFLLMTAAGNPHLPEIVKFLLDSGVDVNGKIKDDIIPLFHAVCTGGVENVKILLKAGADVNIRDSSGKTVIFYSDDPEITKLLIKASADVKLCNSLGETAIFHAYNADIVKALLEAGTNVNIKNNNGQTALFYQENPDIVSILIKAGIEINATDKQGRTALHYAYKSDTIKLLIEAGADVNAIDNEGKTKLHLAVEHCYNFDIIKMLIDAEANVNTKDKFGNIALDYNVIDEDNIVFPEESETRRKISELLEKYQIQ